MVPQHRDVSPRFERDVRLRVNACRRRLRRIKFGRHAAETGKATDLSRDAELSAASSGLIFSSGDGDAERKTDPQKKSDTTA